MQILYKIPNSQLSIPCTLTIGNFDGVHIGHQILLKKLCQTAKKLNLKSVVMTFEPHPNDFFNQTIKQNNNSQITKKRITNLRDKIQALFRNKIDYVMIKHFCNNLANLSPEEFIEKVLIKNLKIHLLIIGQDFCFGSHRSGNFMTLITAGKKYGFKVKIVPNVKNKDGIKISSSNIRLALSHSNFAHAKKLLGHPYIISGRVIHGNKIGRSIGFSTINIRIGYKYPILLGIFIVRVHGLKKYPLPAIASIGSRPTIEDAGSIILETHVFNYNSNCYGQLLSIEFLKKIRSEKKYSNISDLTFSISQDIKQAKDWFKKNKLL